jgi:LmbE family N-acetylglucosaminyl deacetylase
VGVDVSAYLEKKLEAMRAYEAQVKPSLPERSLEVLEALARMQGEALGFEAPRPFMLVRSIERRT